MEDRAAYYASMAIETELELDPLLRYVRDYDQDDQGWNTPLAIETLGELAKQSYKDAADMLCDYVGWGQWWDRTLDYLCTVKNSQRQEGIARKIEERFPLDVDLAKALAWFDLDHEPWTTLARHSARITNLGNHPGILAASSRGQALPPNLAALGVKQLLELADERNRHQLRKVIRQIVQLSDLDLLIESVSNEKPFITDVALAGIARLAPPSVLPWLASYWSANPSMPGFLRVRIGEVMVALPPKLTLPLARERLHHAEWHERHLAEELFGAHAMPEDIPLLRTAIREALADEEENCYRLCHLTETFFNLRDSGPIPELLTVFREFRYSYGRARAAKAIQVTAPGLFCRDFAWECLWDCESQTRILGAQTVPLEASETMKRLHHLASAPSEDEEVRAAAGRRIAGSKPI